MRRRSRPDARLSATDPTADDVFLLIERPLLGGREMAVMERRHHPLLVTDHAVGPMQAPCLPRPDVALVRLALEGEGLHGEPVVDLLAARMLAIPLGFRHGAGGGG